MTRKKMLLYALLFGLISCTSVAPVTSLNYDGYRIDNKVGTNRSMDSILQPYAQRINSTMNEVIGIATNNLSARRPESELGNFMADCFKEMAEKKYERKVDAAFMNAGGIRSYIPKGNITVGKIFELMPFDNLVVIQELKGDVLQRFLDVTAADGGWPMSAGTSIVINNKKATSVIINGKPLDPMATYVIANSDYVANGGSDSELLKGIPQINKGYLMRDALIEYVRGLTAQGKELDPKIENRVKNGN